MDKISFNWTPYCITCSKNLLEDIGSEDSIPNGVWTEAIAKIHKKNNPNHQVINGCLIKEEEADD